MELPLKGIKVTELANVLAGPGVGQFLAEMGADVIKVESIRTCGDVTRYWKLPSEDPGTDISGYFSCVNWGKRSLALDMTKAEGLEIIYRLAERSDIVISSYKPGDAEKLGVDYTRLKERNSNLIYAHITGYGMNNPRAGYDAIIQAESGFTHMNGEPDGKPTKMPVALMDVLAAHQVKEAILLALLVRERGGPGQYIEASLIKSGIASLSNQAANWLVGKSVPGRMGSDHPNIVPYGTIFSTSDNKEIVLAVGTDRQFALLCTILGRPELAEDERFSTNYNRVVNKTELLHILQELIGRHDRAILLETLENNRVPAGGVLDLQEVFETAEAREMLLESAPGIGEGALKGVSSIAFTGSIAVNRKLEPPPHYGQHTVPVLEFLGYGKEQIEFLMEKNVIHANHNNK